MMKRFSRIRGMDELPVLIGKVDFDKEIWDPINCATQIIAFLALDIARKFPDVILEKVEKFNFNILGARWSSDGILLSVSIYAGRSGGMIKVHAAASDSTKAQALKTFHDYITSSISLSLNQDFGLSIKWTGSQV